MTEGSLAVDLNSFLRSVAERWKRLSSAEELVVTSSDILAGTPSSRERAYPFMTLPRRLKRAFQVRIVAAYPGVASEQIDLAALYTQASPPRGWPRSPTPLPAGARVLTRVVPRRKAG